MAVVPTPRRGRAGDDPLPQPPHPRRIKKGSAGLASLCESARILDSARSDEIAGIVIVVGIQTKVDLELWLHQLLSVPISNRSAALSGRGRRSALEPRSGHRTKVDLEL